VTAAPKLSPEFEIERPLVARLREPMGAVRLAVQILAGPLQRGLEQLDEVTRARVQSVLQTLEQSTKQVCEILATAPVGQVQAPAANGPAPRMSVEKTTRAANGPATASEIVTVTRSSVPMLLMVDAHPGLQAADAGRELLPTVVGLVERAARDSAHARPHARPCTVEVRAFVDPAEILGDEMHVVLEVRHDGTALSPSVRAWLESGGPLPHDEPALVAAKTLADAAGGRLEALGSGTKTAIRVRLPESK
jgi:hypothetical protein